MHLQVSSHLFFITIGSGVDKRELFCAKIIIHYIGTYLKLQQKFHSLKGKNDSIKALSFKNGIKVTKNNVVVVFKILLVIMTVSDNG